jgi:hypothetical protein
MEPLANILLRFPNLTHISTSFDTPGVIKTLPTFHKLRSVILTAVPRQKLRYSNCFRPLSALQCLEVLEVVIPDTLESEELASGGSSFAGLANIGA